MVGGDNPGPRRRATELLASDSKGIGYLLKERMADVGDFVDACQRVAAGGTVLDPEVVARHLVVSDGAVETHISSIFSKLVLASTDTEHRRVLAVLQYLQHS